MLFLFGNSSIGYAPKLWTCVVTHGSLSEPRLLEPEWSHLINDSVTSLTRKSLPAQEESELRSQGNHYGEGLQPSSCIALSHQTCCASGDKGRHRYQGKHGMLFVLPWIDLGCKAYKQILLIIGSPTLKCQLLWCRYRCVSHFHVFFSSVAHVCPDLCVQDDLIPNHNRPAYALDACKTEEPDFNPQWKVADSAPPLSSLNVAAQYIPIPTTQTIPNDDNSAPELLSIMGAKPALAVQTKDLFLGSCSWLTPGWFSMRRDTNTRL